MLMPGTLFSKQSRERNDHIIFRHNLEPYDKLHSRLAILNGVPNKKYGVLRRNAKLYSFNPQMHKQQQPPL